MRGSDPLPQQTEPVTADTPVSDAAETDPGIESQLTSVDFDGRGIRILGYRTTADRSYNDTELYESEQTGEPIDDAVYMRNLKTELLLNVKLNYSLPDDEKNTDIHFKNSVMAGDDRCDVLAFKAIYWGTLLTAGVLMPWDDIPGMQLDKPWYVTDANETITVGGHRYGILSDALCTNITMVWTMVFNKRIADEYRIDGLYDTVRSGLWTMDEMTGIVKGVYSDVNGDSNSDPDDLYGFYTDSYATLDAFMDAHAISGVSKDENDMPKVDFMSERLIRSFEKIYELYWNNAATYVDTKEPYTYRLSFAQGKALLAPMLINYMISPDLRAMDDDYGILPFPKLDEAQEKYGTHLLPRTGTYMLPKTLNDDSADCIGYVIDVLSAYSYDLLRPAIYDTTLTEKGVRDEDSLEMLNIAVAGRQYDFSNFLEWDTSYPFTCLYTYRGLLSAKKTDIASYYEKNLSKAEAILQKIADAVNDF